MIKRKVKYFGECDVLEVLSRYSNWTCIYVSLEQADKKYCIYIRPSNATYDAFFCAHGGCAGSNTNTYNSAQFAFKTRALAEYCCEQFITIWKDFMFAKL